MTEILSTTLGDVKMATGQFEHRCRWWTACFAAVNALVVSACGGYWESWPSPPTQETEHGPAEIQPNRLRVVGSEVSPAGNVTVRFSMADACVRTETPVEVQTTRQVKKWSGAAMGGGMMMMGLGTFPTVFGWMYDNSWLKLTGVAALAGGALILYTGRERRRTRTTRTPGTSRRVAVDCPLDEVSVPVSLMTPWGGSVPGVVIEGGVAFKIPWGRSRLDPLAPDTVEQLRSGWSLQVARQTSALRWEPGPSDVDAMIQALGKATGTETEVREGEEPAKLVVEKFEVEGGLLRAGEPGHLVLTIKNTGRGSAYRVIAETKCPDASLHRQQFSFGVIKPGETVRRDITVTMPREHQSETVLVVATFSEANGYAPDNKPLDIEIRASSRPILVLGCDPIRGVDNGDSSNRLVDAGKELFVRCQIRNNGTGPAIDATVTAWLDLAGNEQSRELAAMTKKVSTKRRIEPGGTTMVELYVRVPSDAKAAEKLELEAQVDETNFGVTARAAAIPLEVGAPKICTPPITKKQYKEKLKEIEGWLKEGLITKEQFDTYHAQLVGCLG